MCLILGCIRTECPSCKPSKWSVGALWNNPQTANSSSNWCIMLPPPPHLTFLTFQGTKVLLIPLLQRSYYSCAKEVKPPCSPGLYWPWTCKRLQTWMWCRRSPHRQAHEQHDPRVFPWHSVSGPLHSLQTAPALQEANQMRMGCGQGHEQHPKWICWMHGPHKAYLLLCVPSVYATAFDALWKILQHAWLVDLQLHNFKFFTLKRSFGADWKRSSKNSMEWWFETSIQQTWYHVSLVQARVQSRKEKFHAMTNVSITLSTHERWSWVGWMPLQAASSIPSPTWIVARQQRGCLWAWKTQGTQFRFHRSEQSPGGQRRRKGPRLTGSPCEKRSSGMVLSQRPEL